MVGKRGSITYTTVIHQVKEQFGLSYNAYIIADYIWKLSSNPNARVKGWCYASKDSMARTLGLSRRTVFVIIRDLTEKGLVQKHAQTNYLRTTGKWYEAVHEGRISLDEQARNKHRAETAPPVHPVDNPRAETAPWR